MFKIPQATKEFVQDNSSDRGGNVHITKNINFDDKGYLKLADRTNCLANSDTMTDLGTGNAPVVAIAGLDSRMHIISDKNVYRSNEINNESDLLTWSKDEDTGFPTLSATRLSDMLGLRFDSGSGVDDVILISNGTSTVYEKNGSTWTALNFTEIAEKLCVFDSQSAIAFSNDNKVRLIKLYTGSLTIIQELTLPETYQITAMAYNRGRLYITTRSLNDDGAVIFEWDGKSSEANQGYEVDAKGIFAVTPFESGVAFVDTYGDLWYCYGGLSPLDSFPRAKNHKREYQIASVTQPALFSRGMITDGDNVYIAFNPTRNTLYNNPKDYWSSDFPGGVWCFNKINKLHLKYTIDPSQQLLTDAITTANVNITTDLITVAGATVPATGTPCFYYAISTVITGLKASNKYYVIKVSDTTLKLATTRSNAIAGTQIDLTGTGSNTQYITFNPKRGFGGTFSTYGAILLTKKSSYLKDLASNINNEMLIGGRTQDGASTSRDRIGIYSSQTGQENRGYWITPRMESSNIQDNFNPLIKKFAPMIFEEDKILIKYREIDDTLKNAVEIDGSPENITWVDSTSFTSTSSLGDVAPGDEVEFISGEGAGYLAHVVTITEVTGTYTVTIDETVPIATSDRAVAIFSNWKKIGTITKDDPFNAKGFKKFTPNIKSKWVEFKFELRGEEITDEETLVDNKEHLPL